MNREGREEERGGEGGGGGREQGGEGGGGGREQGGKGGGRWRKREGQEDREGVKFIPLHMNLYFPLPHPSPSNPSISGPHIIITRKRYSVGRATASST